MKIPLTPLVLLVTLATIPSASRAEAPVQSERIAASFVLTLGRAPTAAEIASAEKVGICFGQRLVAHQRQRLESDPALKQATAIKAWRDAFGREPSLAELSGTPSGKQTYTEQVKSHIKYLAEHPEEYERVMERAYRLVIRRGVYAEEIAYWKKRDTLSYVLLVGCVEDWGRRNAPGLMVTAGTPTVSVNSIYLTTIRLSPGRCCGSPFGPQDFQWTVQRT